MEHNQKQRLSDLLNIRPGITAVIGSGGKTTLLRRLAEELPGRVILTTSTHILPFEEFPLVIFPEPADENARADCLRGLEDQLAERRAVCIGRWSDGQKKKLTSPGPDLRELLSYADYILVEADGSKRLPVKAHAPWEPVIPGGTAETVCSVGASGFGKPVSEVCHRPEIFCRLAGCGPDAPVTADLVGKVIREEGLSDRIFLSQSDLLSEAAREEAVRDLSRASGLPCCALPWDRRTDRADITAL